MAFTDEVVANVKYLSPVSKEVLIEDVLACVVMIQHLAIESCYLLGILAQFHLLTIVVELDMARKSFIVWREARSLVLEKLPFRAICGLFLFPPLPHLTESLNKTAERS